MRFQMAFPKQLIAESRQVDSNDCKRVTAESKTSLMPTDETSNITILHAIVPQFPDDCRLDCPLVRNWVFSIHLHGWVYEVQILSFIHFNEYLQSSYNAWTEQYQSEFW
jgi:hypothetical protein